MRTWCGKYDWEHQESGLNSSRNWLGFCFFLRVLIWGEIYFVRVMQYACGPGICSCRKYMRYTSFKTQHTKTSTDIQLANWDLSTYFVVIQRWEVLIARHIIQHIPSVVAAPVAVPAALDAWNGVSWHSGNVKWPTGRDALPWQMGFKSTSQAYKEVIHTRNAPHTQVDILSVELLIDN